MAAPPPLALRLPARLPVELIDRVELRDGRAVVMRPVLPQDGLAEQAFVRGLSPQSRYRRFHAGIPQLPQGMLERLIGVDQQQHVAIVAQPAGWPAAGDDEPEIVADARYVLDAHGRAAEFALAVADEWQGIGLGRLLLRSLSRHATRRGVRELRGDVLMDNRPMIGLVTALGAELTVLRGERGVLQALFRLGGGAAAATN